MPVISPNKPRMSLSLQVANWLPRPGKAKVTYAGGSTFEGVFNGERIKEGDGKYTWMKPAEEDGEDPQASLPQKHTWYLLNVQYTSILLNSCPAAA